MRSPRSPVPSDRAARPALPWPVPPGRATGEPAAAVLDSPRRGEAGSAVVDFVLVGVLVLAVSTALLQLALGLYVRNILTDAAGEGARRAALSDQHMDADPAGALSLTCSDAGCTAGVVRVEAGVDLPILGPAGVGRDVVVLDAERAVTLAGSGRSG